MNILLDLLILDLNPDLKDYIISNPNIKKESESYLEQLLVNDHLLSTDNYTTTATSHQKTLTEEIAELDEYQRVADKKLAAITNDNRELIIDVSQQLKLINNAITNDMKHDISGILKTLEIDTNKKHSQNDQIMENIKNNSSILSNIDSILDLLELPTLCKICILQGNYQEALEISVLARNLVVRFPKLPIVTKIHQQIRIELNLMVKNLIKLLNTNIKQNNLIKIFNILNKLDLTNLKSSDIINPVKSVERTRFLKLVYFNSRFKFIVNELSNLEPLIKFNKFTYLKRFIEVYRGDLYHSLSMFYTVINHSLSLESNENEDNLLINQFIKNLAYHLIRELKVYIPQIISEFDTKDDDDESFKSQMNGLILQIIYLCKSLSKHNQNFENIILWELCYNCKEPLIQESDWQENLQKVTKLKA